MIWKRLSVKFHEIIYKVAVLQREETKQNYSLLLPTASDIMLYIYIFVLS